MAGLQQQQLAVWVRQVAARVSIWGAAQTSTRPVWLAFYPYCNAMSTVRSCCVPNLCSLHASACIMCSVACGSLSNICRHTHRLCHLSARDVAMARYWCALWANARTCCARAMYTAHAASSPPCFCCATQRQCQSMAVFFVVRGVLYHAGESVSEGL